MAIVFGLTALLWVTRADLTIGALTLPGWEGLVRAVGPSGVELAPNTVTNATVAMAMSIACFLLPSLCVGATAFAQDKAEKAAPKKAAKKADDKAQPAKKAAEKKAAAKAKAAAKKSKAKAKPKAKPMKAAAKAKPKAKPAAKRARAKKK